jgi:hypothetical protein
VPAIISLKLEPGEEIDALSDLARKAALDMRLTLSFIHSREFFEHELDQLERLDARISRLVKDLVHRLTFVVNQMARSNRSEKSIIRAKRWCNPELGRSWIRLHECNSRRTYFSA